MRGMNYQGISVICKGDTTTTGGRVLEGAPENYTYEGIPIALMGHKVWCPGCGQTGVIAEGTAGLSYYGVPTALDGHRVACGCPAGSHRLIASSTPRAVTPSPRVFPVPVAAYSPVTPTPEVAKPLVESSPSPVVSPPPFAVFAKSCLRGSGCTDAGRQPEPHTNFAPMGYFRAVRVPEPEQYGQSASGAASAALPAASSTVFPSGSAALEWIGGRFVTGGSWAIRAATAFGEIAVAGVGAPLAAAAVGMMPGKLNEGEQDFIDKMRLSQLANVEGTAPTRVRFVWEDAGHGRLLPKGYHTPPEGGQDQVPVREMRFNRDSGNYEFTTDGPDAVTIYWNPARQDLEIPSDTGNQDMPYMPPSITVLPIPEKVGSDIEIYPAPDERNFRDYILILPVPDMPPIYIYLSKPPVEFLEVELYSDFKRRSRQGKYEADHMPSAAAVREYLRRIDPYASTRQLEDMAKDVAAIVVPKDVHQKLSGTYGGRNTPAQIDQDSRDLRAALDRDLNTIKPALKAEGATEEQIEAARAKMHKINSDVGLYK